MLRRPVQGLDPGLPSLHGALVIGRSVLQQFELQYSPFTLHVYQWVSLVHWLVLLGPFLAHLSTSHLQFLTHMYSFLCACLTWCFHNGPMVIDSMFESLRSEPYVTCSLIERKWCNQCSAHRCCRHHKCQCVQTHPDFSIVAFWPGKKMAQNFLLVSFLRMG